MRRKQRSANPSVSLENDISLELTEELLVKQEVESCDSLPLKAMSSGTISGEGGAVGGIIFDGDDDDESLDGDHPAGDGNQVTSTDRDTETVKPTDNVSEEEEEEGEGREGGRESMCCCTSK